eukprot:723704-Hanusia_phi.AAC.6
MLKALVLAVALATCRGDFASSSAAYERSSPRLVAQAQLQEGGALVKRLRGGSEFVEKHTGSGLEKFHTSSTRISWTETLSLTLISPSPFLSRFFTVILVSTGSLRSLVSDGLLLGQSNSSSEAASQSL